VWQALFDELQGHGFTVIAVALDDAQGARPWIEGARPTYPCLLDREHHLADLYGLVNVPQAVWIDEDGRIVRPPETAGATDGFRLMDRRTFTMPEAVAAERVQVKQRYLDAVRDWARAGGASRYALDAAAVAARVEHPSPAVALAQAHFRLGEYLGQQGRTDEARAHFDEAIRLHPESWAIWRRTAPKDARGLASGDAFWARVDALGDRPYYRPADLGPG
jgi:tetratricopeptide (TPR) repeat protein